MIAFFKKGLKIIGKAVMYFISALLLYVLVGFCLSKIGTDEEPNTPDEIAIYILTNGVHTDLVLPVQTEQMDWSQQLKYEHTNL